MTSAASERITGLLSALSAGDTSAGVAIVQEAVGEASDALPTLLRTAAFHVVREPMYYKKLLNLWVRSGRPELKPAARAIRIELLSDGTVNGIAPYLELFCALYGLSATIEIGAYDSVEHVAFSGDTASGFDITLVLLSDHWLRRWIGAGPVDPARLGEAEAMLRRLVTGLDRARANPVVMSAFGPGAWAAPGSIVRTGELVGHGVAVARLNEVIVSLASPKLLILDIAHAVHRAGGAGGLATLGYLRSRAAFSEQGLLAIAREAAAGIAQVLGRSHRAVLTDWDNTLWGGEVGEVGPLGVVCGQDSPDALGYYLVQCHLRDLTGLGVVLAAISRNAPEAARILDENPDLALRRSHFSSLALGWGRKSQSVDRIREELSFGTDLMLYLDDSLVELAEVLVQHPFIDVMLAGPTPDLTLDRLTSGAFFGVLAVTNEDRVRAERTTALVQQRRQMAEAGDMRSFLASLGMRLVRSSVTADNEARVLQLLQKTNQFNLTTRRHTQSDLGRLQAEGARVGVFAYSDKFGPQGIIGVIILVPDAEAVEVETWAMSCRVLNRGVEQAMLEWIVQNAGGADIIGRYIPTEKNGLVRELYDRLGFEIVSDGPEREYRLASAARSKELTQHQLECVDGE
jgi:FkbH-like protein